MSWQIDLLEQLAAQPLCGYGCSDSPATEPSALAALALAASGRLDPARQVADWLVEIQASNGSVGVRATESEPNWPTSLAVLTWSAIQQIEPSRKYQQAIERSVEWITSHQGVPSPKNEQGHNGMLAAWPWVSDTHTWVEPTSLHVLALQAVGQRDHQRTRDAIAMLIDRQLPQGGLNYGNTVVLGQTLRPHVQPTALALLALANAGIEKKRLKNSLQYLEEQLGPTTTTTSLAWSIMALAAHGKELPAAACEWIESAYHRTLQRDRSRHKLALLALALQGRDALLVTLPLRTQLSSANVRFELPSFPRRRESASLDSRRRGNDDCWEGQTPSTITK